MSQGTISLSINEEINHQAYEDVLDALSPQSNDPGYLACYRGWANVAGPQHFDPHYTPGDDEGVVEDCFSFVSC